MQAIKNFKSRTVVLSNCDVDTDQIIPARFLTTTNREGLGEHLFSEWRYHKDGSKKENFILNQEEAQGCEILVAGDNFGCGSSREHAPWALHDYGFRVVVSTSIADIFRSNSLKNGLIPVVVNQAVHQQLIDAPGMEIAVSLEDRSLTLADGERISFQIDDFSRYCLMNGVDELGFLMSKSDQVKAYEDAQQ